MEIPAKLRPLLEENWIPKERAVLTFIIEKSRIMLIHKKTGLGKGLINAPGGRIEENESPQDAAVRETKEEIGVDVFDLKCSGELFFQFTDGYSLHAFVYRTSVYTGSPISTEEADPFWSPLGKIPFEKMWEDDRLWIPYMIDETFFKGYFLFEGETMLEQMILTGEELK